jgi:hypothetical protein
MDAMSKYSVTTAGFYDILADDAGFEELPPSLAI